MGTCLPRHQEGKEKKNAYLHASSRGEGDLSSQVAPCGVGVAPWVASRQEAWPREAASLCPSYQEDRASCPAGAGLACPCRLQDASAVRRGVRQEVPQGARREVHQADAPAGVRTPQHQEAGALLDPPVGSSLVAMVLPHHAQVPAVLCRWGNQARVKDTNAMQQFKITPTEKCKVAPTRQTSLYNEGLRSAFFPFPLLRE